MITSSSTTRLPGSGYNMSRGAYYGITYLDTIQGIETELKKRLSWPRLDWGTKQTDGADKITNAIYTISTWEGLLKWLEVVPEGLRGYAVNRWFNFWSARAVEMIFCAFENVEPFIEKDRLVDFTIQGVTFDHKTSVYPKNFPFGLQFAKRNPERLAQWLYDNQSNCSRRHYANRLFIILYSDDGQHWRLRADLSGLYETIEQYVIGFDPNKLLQVGAAKSDVIWYESHSNW